MEQLPLRQCSRCSELKPEDDFAWRRKKKGERQRFCRACMADYGRHHYQANKPVYKKRALARKHRLARERGEYLLKYFKSHPCVDCGESDPVVLEFDHLRDKECTIGAVLTFRNWESLLDEIAKCEVVCANCHRRRTASRGGWIRAMLAAAET